MNREYSQSTLDATFQQAIAFHQSGRLIDALEGYRRVITQVQQYVEAFLNAGVLLERFSQFKEALENYDAAIALQPALPDSYCLRGNLLFKMQRFDEALASYDRAIAIRADLPEAYLNRGLLLTHMGRFEDALASYERAIITKPDYVGAYVNRGHLLKELRRFDEALTSYERALAINPNAADAYNNRGILLGELKQYDAALDSYKQAIARKPDYAEAHVNLGILLAEIDRVEESLASYDRALAIRPDYAMAYNNKAILLKETKRFDEAFAAIDRAIAVKPDFADAYYTRAELLLLAGNYAQGWALFEWRWQSRYREAPRPLPGCRTWTGEESLAGKSILIEPEVGFGDQIMFARYARLLELQGAKVLLSAAAPLLKLFASLGETISLVEEGGALPGVDFRCPIMSLPKALKTTQDSIPASFPYLSVRPERRAVWHARLGTARAPRIGLMWAGAADRYLDKNPRTRRSMPLESLQSLLELPYEFHSLQKDVAPGDVEAQAGFANLISHHDDLHDFADTAALIEEMDLVISIDTSVAHLAGALGKPVWVMLPYASDYRWLNSGAKTPWYPTADLFRQSSAGNWQSVVEQVEQALIHTFAK